MRADDGLIAAISTPQGVSGIAVVRLSGDGAARLEEELTRRPPTPARSLVKRSFLDANGETIDQGLAALFPAPGSFTGQDMLELHCHGGPAVTGLLLARCCELGARPAAPGEFSLRAYLNDKIDLARAEAVCDLINASTEGAARAAARTLEGELSGRVRRIAGQLVEARTLAEAHLDFPEEDIPPQTAASLASLIGDALSGLDGLLQSARQGVLLNRGIRVAVVGPTNAGKSSLVNRLCGEDVSIVTDIAGTTRDLVRHSVSLAGIRVEFVDTAGLRESEDPVEVEGVRRTRDTATGADLVVLVLDGPRNGNVVDLGGRKPDITVHNKIDLRGEEPRSEGAEVWLSAKFGQGVDLLEKSILGQAGHERIDGVFMARPRQLDALNRARDRCGAALAPGLAAELVAEELRGAHDALGEITGRMTPDELLGEIFSKFCIGK